MQSYIAGRGAIEEYVATGNYPEAAEWLRRFPDAKFFGVDDGIHAAFATHKQARRWLAEIREDIAMWTAEKRAAARHVRPRA